MTQDNAMSQARKRVDRMMHDAHLRYQRAALAPSADASPAHNANALPCSEVRGVKRVAGVSERKAREAFKPEWFSHLRPNFWKAYFETLLYMTSA